MRFTTALSEELSKHSPKEDRAKVASIVYRSMSDMGFNIAIVNDKGFDNLDEEPEQFFGRRTYWMRRNNSINCWEIA